MGRSVLLNGHVDVVPVGAFGEGGLQNLDWVSVSMVWRVHAFYKNDGLVPAAMWSVWQARNRSGVSTPGMASSRMDACTGGAPLT